MNLNRINTTLASWLLFIIWPFFMFVLATKKFFNRNNQVFIIAFAFLYGYSVFITGGDVKRYHEGFALMPHLSWNDFSILLLEVYSPVKSEILKINTPLTSKPDIYAGTLGFLVSRFTDNSRWFFTFVSAIYMSLLLGLSNYLYKNTNWIRNYFPQKMFFIAFLLIVPFYFPVIGVRFWPALIVFVHYGLKFMDTGRLKYFLLAASSALFHYTFLIPLVLLIISKYFIRTRYFIKPLLFVGVIMLSLSSVSSKLGYVQDLTTSVEETSINDASSSYTNEDILDERKGKSLKTNWYVRYSHRLMMYFIIIIGVLDVAGFFRFKENEFTLNMFPLYAIFLILVLFTMDLGSIGRFKFVFYMLFFIRFIVLSGIQPNDFRFKMLSYILLPIFIFYMLVILRGGLYTVEPTLLLNNLFGVFFTHSDISLSEFLVGH